MVCVGDFNIGNPRFGYNSYNDVECGPGMLAKFADKIPHYYTNNPEAQYELPACSPIAVAARRTSRLASHTTTCSTTATSIATKPRAPDPAPGFCGRGFSRDHIPLQPDSIPIRIVADTHGQPGAHRVADDVSRRGMEQDSRPGGSGLKPHPQLTSSEPAPSGGSDPSGLMPLQPRTQRNAAAASTTLSTVNPK